MLSSHVKKRSLVRYRVQHSKIKFISTRGHVISSIYLLHPCSYYHNYLAFYLCSVRSVADPHLELSGAGGAGGLDFLALLAFFPSVISSFLPKKGGARVPRAPLLDSPPFANYCLEVSFNLKVMHVLKITQKP